MDLTMTNKTKKTKGFSAQQFVDKLLTDGNEVMCDETLEHFRNTELPLYYDEKLYKRGRAFFYENIYALLFSKFFGLISVIALPESLKVLRMTKRTGSALSAYRRYAVTLLHVVTWYSDDFSPGSRLLASITDVKNKHNAASKQSNKKLKYRFSQKDMALTQFGFMGYGLIRSELVGLHSPTDEELQAFIHVWRVLGYILGIEDRFNICRESVQETREICDILVKKIFTPLLNNPEEDFVEMINYLVDGLSASDVLLDYDYSMTYLQMIIENNSDYNNLKNQNYNNISWIVKLKLNLASTIIYLLKFKIFKIYYNYVTLFRLWFSTIFPIVPYIRFGIKNARINFDKIINFKPKST